MHRIDALSADNQKAVQYWAINANILRNKVKAAMADWVSSGYKNDYEQIAAFIDQVMQRDMSLLKAQYRDDLEKHDSPVWLPAVTFSTARQSREILLMLPVGPNLLLPQLIITTVQTQVIA